MQKVRRGGASQGQAVRRGGRSRSQPPSYPLLSAALGARAWSSVKCVCAGALRGVQRGRPREQTAAGRQQGLFQGWAGASHLWVFFGGGQAPRRDGPRHVVPVDALHRTPSSSHASHQRERAPMSGPIVGPRAPHRGPKPAPHARTPQRAATPRHQQRISAPLDAAPARPCGGGSRPPQARQTHLHDGAEAALLLRVEVAHKRLAALPPLGRPAGITR